MLTRCRDIPTSRKEGAPPVLGRGLGTEKGKRKRRDTTVQVPAYPLV